MSHASLSHRLTRYMNNNGVMGRATFDFKNLQNSRGIQCVGRQSINGFSRNSNDLPSPQQISRAAHGDAEEIWTVSVKNFSLGWFGQFGKPSIE